MLHGRWRHEASWRRRRTGGERAASLNMRVRVMARARAWSDVDGAVRGGTGRGRIERHGPVGDISCQCHRNWSGFHHARVWTRAAKGRRRDSEPDRLTEKRKDAELFQPLVPPLLVKEDRSFSAFRAGILFVQKDGVLNAKDLKICFVEIVRHVRFCSSVFLGGFVHQLKVETDEQKPKPNLEPVPDPTHPKAHLRSKSKPADG